MRKLVAKAAVLTLTMAAAGTFTTAGPAAAEGHHFEHADHGTTVLVHGNGSTVTLSRNQVHPGRITFKVDTSNQGNGSQITLFRLVGNATLATFKADLVEEFSQDHVIAAKGTHDLNRDVRAFGLADVVPSYPEMVTERLRSGSYYLMDLANVGDRPPNPVFTTFTVGHSGKDGEDHGRGRSESQGEGEGHHGPVIKLTSADTIQSPLTLPAHGTVTVKNVGDSIHFMGIERVVAGTTDAKIQAFFDAILQGTPPTGPPPFADGLPGGGMDVLSPGHQLDLTYDLPPGTYVLACFVADDVTGVAHALMGMHKVVTLK